MSTDSYYNTIIIGAGPIGIEVAAACKAQNINYLHLEAGQIAGFIATWQPGTQFFSSPEWIAVAGVPIHTTKQQNITAEEYLAYLRLVVEQLELPINTFERVERIERIPPDAPADTENAPRFRLHTTAAARGGGRNRYTCTNIILATGNMQLPNEFHAPGDDLPTTHHSLRNPHHYFRRRLLIVGAKNSACEAALRCWRAGAHVAISSRRPALQKRGILQRLYLEVSLLIKNKQIAFHGSTEVERIAPGRTTLRELSGKPEGRTTTVDSDFVYLAVGFRPDPRLYQQLAIELRTDERLPVFNPRTMEIPSCRGVYIAGTATGGHQRRHTVFITTCHDHASKITRAIAGKAYTKVGNFPGRNYPLTSGDIE